jgi:transposase
MLNGILWILRTGAPWRDLPARYGSWNSVYGRFNRWSKDGTFDAIVESLQGELDAGGKLDRDLWCLDASSVRATRAAAGARHATPVEPKDHALGRSRGGLGTKFHLICDSQGVPVAVVLSPGQMHDSQRFEQAMQAVRIPQLGAPPRRRPKRLAADKAYGSRAIRAWLRQHKIQAVIPTKSNEAPSASFDRAAYRNRNVVERCICWLKESRRVATRYEKLARTFLAMVKLAMMDRLLIAGLGR